MSKEYKHLETKLIHSGEPDPRIEGAVAIPIFQSAMFEYAGEKSYNDLKYIRLNNTPNHIALHTKLAALENAEAALVTGSGMAAISTTLLTLLPAGSHLLIQDCLYGGTHDFVNHDFASFGLEHTFIDADDAGSWKHHLKPNTKSDLCRIHDKSTVAGSGLTGGPRICQKLWVVFGHRQYFCQPCEFSTSGLGLRYLFA